VIHKFDLWLGKTMFIPIAIRLCQQFKISQYTLHTYLWLCVWFYWLSQGPHAAGGWLMFGVLSVMATIWVVISALAPDYTRRSLEFVRLMFVLFLLMDLPVFILGVTVSKHFNMPHVLVNDFKDWVIVLAEYALTISTIPPLEAKEKKRAAKLARQNA
jgi:hypothetical protein